MAQQNNANIVPDIIIEENNKINEGRDFEDKFFLTENHKLTKNEFINLMTTFKNQYLHNFENKPGIVYFVIPSMIQFFAKQIIIHPLNSNIFS